VRPGAYPAFETILERAGAPGVDVEDFWEAWEGRNIEQYWSRGVPTAIFAATASLLPLTSLASKQTRR
jgi:hypothetical protein